MENRYIRLTTERFEDSNPRFENMLMTTRRAPVFGGYGAAASLRVVNPAGSFTPRKSFFNRFFSTTSVVQTPTNTDKAPAVLLSRLQIMRRQLSLLPDGASIAALGSSHRALKERGVAKERRQEITNTYSSGTGSIDLRLVRGKSPRSGEYLQRASFDKKDKPATFPLTRYHTFMKKHIIASGTSVYRSGRKTIFNSIAADQDVIAMTQTAIAPGNTARNVRSLVSLRRAPLFLVAQRTAKRAVVAAALIKRKGVYAQASHLKKSALRNNTLSHFFKKLSRLPIKTNKKLTSMIKQAANDYKHIACKAVVSNNRSILHFRKAEARLMKPHYFTAPLSITSQVPRIKRIVRKVGQKHNFRVSLAVKMLKEALKNPSLLLEERSEKIKRLVMLRAKKRADDSTFLLPLNKIRLPEAKSPVLRRYFSPRRHLFPKGRLSQILSKRNVAKPSKSLLSYFKTNAAVIRKNKKQLSKIVAAIEKRRERTAYNNLRPKL